MHRGKEGKGGERMEMRSGMCKKRRKVEWEEIIRGGGKGRGEKEEERGGERRG